jgi:hypothetical protein
MSICPNENELLQIGQVDAVAINFINQIYTEIQNAMIEKTTYKAKNIVNYSLFAGTCSCEKISSCKLNICDLIAIINKVGFNFTSNQFYQYVLKPMAFAVNECNQFIPIADPEHGGLVGNPNLYDFNTFRVMYAKALENPQGNYADFTKVIRQEGVEDCVIPLRAYVRILPKCFKKYGTIVILVEYPLLTARPIGS